MHLRDCRSMPPPIMHGQCACSGSSVFIRWVSWSMVNFLVLHMRAPQSPRAKNSYTPWRFWGLMDYQTSTFTWLWKRKLLANFFVGPQRGGDSGRQRPSEGSVLDDAQTSMSIQRIWKCFCSAWDGRREIAMVCHWKLMLNAEVHFPGYCPESWIKTTTARLNNRKYISRIVFRSLGLPTVALKV